MRLHTAFFGLLLLTSTAYADPSWWAARRVISTTTAANLAPANIGQAKHMAAMALAELQGKLPATSHQALQADVALIADLSLPDPLPPGYHETQRAVLLNGQLKAIAKPFYDNLRTHNAAWLDNAMAAANLTVMEPGSNPLTPSPYPWSVATTDDANRAPATLGQLKAVFSLPLETLTDISTTLDTDGDGMTDAWEIQYSLNPNDPSDANTDADNDGFSNLQEYQSNSNPTNASAIPGDRDGDSLADDLDAVPDDAEINWPKTPENRYVWIEQVTGASTGGGAPKHVNARGQILFEYSHPHPPIYETYPEETLDNVLWDSASQAWIPLATSGSGNSGKVIELFGLSDQGFVFGASHTFSDFQPDSPSVNSAGMIWKPSAPSPNTYLSPTHFMPDVVNRITSGVDWRGTVSNDGIANCTTFRSNSTVGWETYNGNSTSQNLTSITDLGNEDRVAGAILDATASLMLLKSYQPGSSWSLKLYDGSQVANVDGLLPANNLGDYTPETDINITLSLKTNGQRRLWLAAHYYASGAYHYPVRIEKRAGGTGAARWHQPPSMAEGAWKLNARGEAIKSAKIWRNGTYTNLNTITSKPETVTITHAIDLASNGIILAQAVENGVNKAGLLIPVEFDMAIASYGELADLPDYDDRQPGGDAQSPPNELDPGSMVIAPVQGNSSPGTRSRLKLSAKGQGSTSGTYTLTTKNLSKVAIYNSPTGGTPLLPADLQWDAEEFVTDKLLYVGSQAFAPTDLAQDGTLTFTFTPNFTTGSQSSASFEDHVRVQLVPVEIGFSKPDDWTDLPEEQVILFDEETRIQIRIGKSFDSLEQAIQMCGLSPLQLSTNGTCPAGVDIILNSTNSTYVSNKVSSEVRVTFTRQQLKDNGLLQPKEVDGVNEIAWYDFVKNEKSNLKDSLAFDNAHYPAVGWTGMRGRGYDGGNIEENHGRPLDKTLWQAGGAQVIVAQSGGAVSKHRQLSDQADTFFFSGHGAYASGNLEINHVGSPQEEEWVTPGETKWDKDMDIVIVNACAVFGIKSGKFRYKNFSERHKIAYNKSYKYLDPSPGEKWESLSPPIKLGYCFTSPLDSTGISEATIKKYGELVNGGKDPIAAWGEANIKYDGRYSNACAIDTSKTPHEYWYVDSEQFWMNIGEPEKPVMFLVKTPLWKKVVRGPSGW